MNLIATLTEADYENPATHYAETALVYSAADYDGWRSLVYLAGNVSEPGYWSTGILWDTPPGIGGFVVIIED